MEETPSSHPVAVIPTVVTEKEESEMNEEKAVHELSKALVADILPSKEEITLDQIGQNGNGDHFNGLSGEKDEFGGSAHAKIHEEHQEDMKQPLIDLEPEVHPAEDQEVPEPTRVEEDKEKPPTPTVDQATPDSALSEEEQQEDKIAPPTPPPSHFETPVPEGEDIQEDVARKLIEQHLEQNELVDDPVAAKPLEHKHPHVDEDIVESQDVPKEPEAKLELDTSPVSEDIVSSEEVLTESQLPLSPTAETPSAVPLDTPEEVTNPSVASVKSLDLTSAEPKEADVVAKKETKHEEPSSEAPVPPKETAPEPVVEQEIVESEPVSENVPQVEAQEHAAHPPTEPKLVEQEDEPVKHVLLEPDNLEEVKEPEPPHTPPVQHGSAAAVVHASHAAARPKTPEITIDTTATESDAHKSPKFPVESESTPVVHEEKPARPPPPVKTHSQEENKPSTSEAAADHPSSGDEGNKEKKTGTLTRARESIANARKRCAIL
ncbi:hypothetical protein AAVH_01519 [Aphelenchoides avenae]|nr:hypothetical protein AAVH_01519 [Aphelenchus avenae]